MGLDNREIASLIVLVAIAALLVANRHTRRAVRGVGAALTSNILIPFVGLAAWAAGLAVMGSQLRLWEQALLAETVLWFVTPAVPLLFGLIIRQKGLRGAVIHAIGPGVLLGVFVGLSTFGLVIELLLAVALTVILPLLAVAETRDEYAPVRRSLEAIVGVIGVALFLHVLISVASDWEGFDKVLALRALALPVWMTLGVLPYGLAVRLWVDYDSVFNRVKHEANDCGARRRAQLALILEFGLSPRQGASFRTYYARQLVETQTVREARAVVREYLRDQRRREAEAAEAGARLIRFAGVVGEDEDGRRLDQREFEQTRSALQWIATAQMGWYERRGGQYRPDLLQMLAPFKGLPADHGISLSVSTDGKSWRAWRRTVTGWCFAIGAAEAPPDQWLYDGPEPPKGFPGHDPAWGEQWDLEAKNW